MKQLIKIYKNWNIHVQLKIVEISTDHKWITPKEADSRTKLNHVITGTYFR